MSRLNPKRRRYQAQAALLLSIRNEHGPSHDDSAKLQRGSPVTTSGSKFARNGTYATVAPRPFFEPDYSKPVPTRITARGPNTKPFPVDMYRMGKNGVSDPTSPRAPRGGDK